jgi:hypothetical protein
MWVTIRDCEFFKKDGSTFKVPKGTKLKEVSSVDNPSIGRWIKNMHKSPVNKNKSFVVLWCEGKARMFTINESVVRFQQGMGSAWRV